MPRKLNLFFASALIVMAATNTTLGNAYAQENTYGPVKSGELIWNIAGKVTPNASVSRQQVIIGILRANPSAFKVPCNFNSLKVGEKLIVPALTDIQVLSQEEAKKEFDGQNEAWKNRKKNPIVCPAPEVATAAETATTAVVSPPPSPTSAEVPPPTETPPAAVSNDSPTGASQTPPPVTPPTPPVAPVAPPVTVAPPVAPPVAPQPAETTTAPPAVSPPSEAPKQEADNVAPPPPTASTSSAPVATPTSPTESVSPPVPSSSSPPKTPSQLPDLIIWILIGGGVLSAFIIAGLLHAHAKHEASVSADPNRYNFAENKKSDDADDMPLYDDPNNDRNGDRSGDVVKE